MISLFAERARASLVAQYFRVLIAGVAACTAGCATYGTGNYLVAQSPEIGEQQLLLFPPGVSPSRNLSMVLPMDWIANCEPFELALKARGANSKSELARLSAASTFTSIPRVKLKIASPARVDPRELANSFQDGLLMTKPCFKSVSEDTRKEFRSNLLELVSTLIPRTFDEDFWHANLLFPGANEKIVALRPGMRLRLVFSHFYSALQMTEQREGWASAGTSSVVYDVVSRGGCTTLTKWRHAVYGAQDANFNQTALAKVIGADNTPEPTFFADNFRLVNGSWDFVNPACTDKAGVLVLRYPSLVVPQAHFVQQGKTINALGLPMLFAAKSYQSAIGLSRYANSVSDSTQTGKDARDALGKACRDARCFLLSARALPVPEIEVTINGARTWVELGTRIRDVIRADRGSLGAVIHESLNVQSPRRLTIPQPRSMEIRRLAPLSRSASVEYRSVPDIVDLFLASDDDVTWQ